MRATLSALSVVFEHSKDASILFHEIWIINSVAFGSMNANKSNSILFYIRASAKTPAA